MLKIKALIFVAFFSVIIALISVCLRGGNSFTSNKDQLGFNNRVEQSPTPTPLPQAKRKLHENELYIAEAKMYLTVPKGMTFRDEISQDAGRVMNRAIYLQNESYQLYIVFPVSIQAGEADLDKAISEMSSETVKKVVIGSKTEAVEGLVGEPKSRYLTLVLKDGLLISFSTYPPTATNKKITDQILSFISFDP